MLIKIRGQYFRGVLQSQLPYSTPCGHRVLMPGCSQMREKGWSLGLHKMCYLFIGKWCQTVLHLLWFFFQVPLQDIKKFAGGGGGHGFHSVRAPVYIISTVAAARGSSHGLGTHCTNCTLYKHRAKKQSLPGEFSTKCKTKNGYKVFARILLKL